MNWAGSSWGARGVVAVGVVAVGVVAVGAAMVAAAEVGGDVAPQGDSLLTGRCQRCGQIADPHGSRNEGKKHGVRQGIDCFVESGERRCCGSKQGNSQRARTQ